MMHENKERPMTEAEKVSYAAYEMKQEKEYSKMERKNQQGAFSGEDHSNTPQYLQVNAGDTLLGM